MEIYIISSRQVQTQCLFESNNVAYLALLILSAGDIETNPGPNNISTYFILLLLLYIKLDGCWWRLSVSLASPMNKMTFNEQSNSNGSIGNGGSGGLTRGEEIQVGIGVAAPTVAVLGTIVTIIIAVSKCCSHRVARTEHNFMQIPPGQHCNIVNCARFLKSFYKDAIPAKYSTPGEQWPPINTTVFIRLAMVVTEEVRSGNVEMLKEDQKLIKLREITDKVDNIPNHDKKKVPIKLKDIFSKCKSGQKRILIEGARGSGKSTLSLHICSQWAVGQLYNNYKLVILVRLRDPILQKAKDISEILPRDKYDAGERQHIAKEIKNCNGKGVLFVLDGWDELPAEYQRSGSESLFHKLLTGETLHRCSIIVTSRPTSSAGLQRLSSISSRIEILGFTKEDLRKYFISCFQSETVTAKNRTAAARREAENLLHRIKNNPIIEGICYLPLNASILVFLYKCERNKLPSTQYGIFTNLVCHCIHRHYLKEMTTGQDIVLKSLDELPPDINTPFQEICKIAYSGIMNDQVIFDDLDTNINTLGLLQDVETVDGSKYFHFHHLSIQELLAAVYMAKLDEREQTEQFKQLFKNPRFSAVFQFFAAKTKLKSSEISEIVRQLAKSGNKAELLSLMHCLFEAQESTLCKIVADELAALTPKTFDLSDIHLNSASCYSIGYFLTHCENFQVVLRHCSIGDEGTKILFRQKVVYNLKALMLDDNSIGNEGAKAISDAMKKMINLQWLSLSYNSISAEGAMAILDAMKTIKLQWLDLRHNYLGTKVREALKEAGRGTNTNIYGHEPGYQKKL